MFEALKLARSATRFLPTAGTFTKTLAIEKAGLSSALSWASSFRQNARPRLAPAEVLYCSIVVRTSVIPAAPLYALP